MSEFRELDPKRPQPLSEHATTAASATVTKSTPPTPDDPAARRAAHEAAKAAHRPDDTVSLKERLAGDRLGGTLLIVAAVIALIVANTPLQDWYHDVAALRIGPAALHLDLTVHEWASDGLLTIFFFTVGLELKREFTTGSLRNPRRAILPILAAVFGMVGPALVYVGVMAATGFDGMHGWAIPTATDIAFAVAVLAIFGRGLPSSFRTFLLTLAVVDDLLAIIVIAFFYSSGIALGWLIAALATVAVYALLLRRGLNGWWYLIPLGVLAWAFMHAAGVHATIAGVLLGLVVPARPFKGDTYSLAEDFEHDWSWISQCIALPIFAFFAAGVTVHIGEGGPAAVFTHPVLIAVTLGLVVGKIVGIGGITSLLSWLPQFALPPRMTRADLFAIGGVGGIGFTVALLVSQLAFGEGAEAADEASLGVLIGSFVAVLLGAALISWRGRAHRRIRQREEAARRVLIEDANAEPDDDEAIS